MKRIYILIGLIHVIAFSACRKLLDVPATAQSQSPAKTVFDNSADAETAFLGLYSEMMNNPSGTFNGNISLDAGLSSDELACTKAGIRQDSFYHNSLNPGFPLSQNLYTNSYYFVYFINSTLAGISASTGLTDSMKLQLQGEAEFDRGLIYFYLVNLYGGVPIVLTSDFTKSASLPRSSVNDVYNKIIADLSDAQLKLSSRYTSTAMAPNDRTRPNQEAASALLARVWLYLGQWANAEIAATAVIGDSRYQLEGDLTQVFLSTSAEAIWQLQPVYDMAATADASFFIPSIAAFPPLYDLTPALLGSFEPGDLRQAYWTRNDTIRQQVFVYPYKYKQTQYTPANPEYEMVLRLAEQFLIRAEARAMQGDIGGAAADLNMIRQRAGLPNTNASDQVGMLAAIMQERRVELFSEWGHRWLDLKRTGAIDTVMAAVKIGWVSTDALYPLPEQDILANPNLVQNPGYTKP